jgi:hypothetical protein
MFFLALGIAVPQRSQNSPSSSVLFVDDLSVTLSLNAYF